MKSFYSIVFFVFLSGHVFADSSWIAFEYFQDKNYDVQVELFHQPTQKLIYLDLDAIPKSLPDSIQSKFKANSNFKFFQLSSGQYTVKSIKLSHRKLNATHKYDVNEKVFKLQENKIQYLGRMRAKLRPFSYPRQVEFHSEDNYKDLFPSGPKSETSKNRWVKTIVDFK